jgi:two-component system, sensor histidine kinase and response regulator
MNNSSPPRVLIVDDEARNRLVLGDYLESMRITTEEARDGLECMFKVEDGHFDLILLDIMMPGMDGFDTLKELRSRPSTSDLPVVVISALDGIDSVVRCIELGADDFLPKPFKRPILKARVEACIERKRLRDQEKLFREKDRQQLETIRESYRQLKLTERSRDNFSNMIVHDLNSPLNSIIGYADLIRMYAGDDETSPAADNILRCADQLRESATRMTDLTSSILDVSKFENGQLDITGENLNISQFASDVYQRNCELADRDGLEFKLNLPPEPAYAFADATLLPRVIDNLTSNSLKYASSFVRFGVEKTDLATTKLEFINDGYPISSEDQQRVFDKYYQCDSAGGRLSKRYGVGLGLTFCKLAVDAMGGRIWTDNGKDERTHFYVELPTTPA